MCLKTFILLLNLSQFKQLYFRFYNRVTPMALMIPRAILDDFEDDLFVVANARMDAMADKLSLKLLGETDQDVIEAKIGAAIEAITEEIRQLKANYQQRCFIAATDSE